MKNYRLSILIVVLFFLALACGNSPVEPLKKEPIVPLKAVYRITSTGGFKAFVTYTNAGGSIEQREITTPWETSFDTTPGKFLQVSAQLKSAGSLPISCEIEVDGQKINEANSEGEYVIASCQGTAK